MSTSRRVAMASFVPLLFASSLRAQGSSDIEGCAACGTCGAGLGVIVFLFFAILALNIALLIWVARDAKARGMDSAVVWMLLVMVTGPLGFLIYIFSRPKGLLVPCPNCGNKRLEASATCPHCGNS